MMTGDLEARAELGMPETIKGNLKAQPTQPQEPVQTQQSSADRLNILQEPQTQKACAQKVGGKNER